ncbi:hypothetical protein K353_06618 [Kitasatospora sp. SolWspMP-SS2h]|nr:hypothetical protein K353_06618 [Kitasatospora sp. SolWspMP-SS2h]
MAVGPPGGAVSFRSSTDVGRPTVTADGVREFAHPVGEFAQDTGVGFA